MTQPDLPGGWSIKDLLAHFEYWEERVVKILMTLRKGEEPRLAVDGSTVDNVNEQVFLQNRARGLDDVRKGELEAYRALVSFVESAPEDELFDAGRYAWTKGAPYADWIIGNSYGHWEEHMPNLEALLIARSSVNPIVSSAQSFINEEGRDIIQAQFDFHFAHQISLDELMTVLARYQTPEGGFTGLEVDIQAPQSNPFAIELALIVMKWAGVPGSHPVLQKTVAFLEDTQGEDGTWQFTPEIYQHELAPWFKAWEWPNLNPSCPIAGLLKQLGVGSDRLHQRVQVLFDRQANFIDLTGNQFYQAKPYADYFQTEWDFPQAEFYRMGVVWWLLRQHVIATEIDATHWMQLAPAPNSAVTSRLPEPVLQAEIDRLIADQSEDGGWPTPYSPRWRGWITINNLLTLKAYGRI